MAGSEGEAIMRFVVHGEVQGVFSRARPQVERVATFDKEIEGLDGLTR